MSQISVPVFVRRLNGLANCLKKAQAHYSAKGFDEGSLLAYRFYPDMFDFARQVQVATDHAKSCTAMLAGVEAPKYEDDEIHVTTAYNILRHNGVEIGKRDFMGN